MGTHEDYWNSEGYHDPTAGAALKNIAPQVKRGDIYYIEIPHSTGHEMAKDRPAIIVSCDELNRTSPVVSVVFCSTSNKRDLPEHITIRSTPIKSTALCENIYGVDKSRIGKLLGRCTAAEMESVGIGIMAGLDLGKYGLARAMDKTKVAAVTTDVQSVKEVVSAPVFDDKTARLEAELETYRRLYDGLLDRVTRRASA